MHNFSVRNRFPCRGAGEPAIWKDREWTCRVCGESVGLEAWCYDDGTIFEVAAYHPDIRQLEAAWITAVAAWQREGKPS